MNNILDNVIVYIDEQSISSKVKELGRIITSDYYDKNLLVICILKGSSVFTADLIREIKLPLEVDFMIVSSYGDITSSDGNVKIIKDLETDIKDYHVLIAEDILDTGYTLSALVKLLRSRNPLSLKICTLLDKPDRHVKNIAADYIGFTIENKFVVGYGLDCAEKYRNLKYVGILDHE